MSTVLFHFLTIVGKAGEEAARELLRLREIVGDRNTSERDGPDIPEFANFCKSLLMTRFQTEAIHYSCIKWGYGWGNSGVRGFADEACGDNAALDLNWAATFYSHACSAECLAVADKHRAENISERFRYEHVWFEEMLSQAIGIGIIYLIPFHVFVVTEDAGPSADDRKIRNSLRTSFDELCNRAQAKAATMPATARGNYGR
jgi:hypothetical protein